MGTLVLLFWFWFFCFALFFCKVNAVGFTVISIYQYLEIAPCNRNFQVFPFTFIFFSRRPSSQVAGIGGGSEGVGPAKMDLYLPEQCGSTEDLQVQPMYLVLHGCVCSLVAMCPSEFISLRPKSLRQPQPSSQGAGCLVTHRNLGISRPKGGRYLPVWTSLISESAHGFLQQQGISHGSFTTDYHFYF